MTSYINVNEAVEFTRAVALRKQTAAMTVKAGAEKPDTLPKSIRKEKQFVI